MNRRIYAFSWYLDVFAPHWKALVWNDYEFVMPITAKNKWGLINKIYQPNFTQQLGIFGSQNLDNDILNQFLSFISKKYYLIYCQLNSLNIDEKLTQRPNYILRLNRPYLTIWKSIDYNRRKRIEKAKTLNYVISESNEIHEVVSKFYAQKNKTLLGNLKWSDFEVFSRFISDLIIQKKAICFQILEENEPLTASIFLLDDDKRAYLIFNYSNEKARKLNLNNLLINHFIEQYAERMEILDFEGSSIEGVASYYKSFGTENEIYYSFHKNFFN